MIRVIMEDDAWYIIEYNEFTIAYIQNGKLRSFNDMHLWRGEQDTWEIQYNYLYPKLEMIQRLLCSM